MENTPANYSPAEIRQRIEELLHRIEEYRFMPVVNEEGDIVCYDDLNDF